MHDGVFVAHFVGSLCQWSRSNAALFDKGFDEVSDKVVPMLVIRHSSFVILSHFYQPFDAGSFIRNPPRP
jgi:hypothetical protein